MLNKIKCFFGYHRWEQTLHTSRHGYAYGDKCLICRKWSDESVRNAWTEEEFNEFYLDDGHH